MNVYDFDGTIYRGDSSVDFCTFVMRRHPGALRHLPAFSAAVVRKKAEKITTRELKEVFFRFLADVPDIEQEVAQFWLSHERKIMPWYLESKQPTDVIISASPEFLLAPICRKLKTAALIASQVDPKTGQFRGANCKGEEKVRRFRALYPDAKVGQFYSDSKSDLPMARLAEQAFLVQKGSPAPWEIRKGAHV